MTKGIILALGVLTLAGCSKAPEDNRITTYICFTPLGMLRDTADNVKDLGSRVQFKLGDAEVTAPSQTCITIKESAEAPQAEEVSEE